MLKLRTVEKLILFINIIIVLFITMCIYITTKNIVIQNSATEFINSVDGIAYDVERLLTIIVLLCSSIIILELFYHDNSFFITIIDLILIMAVIYLLGFNYNGIIMIVLVKGLSMTEKVRAKYFLIVLAVVLFVISDQGLISTSLKTFIFNDYINYYRGFEQRILASIYTILKSINIIVFILYSVVYIREQRERIEEINNLYNQLNNANIKLKEMNNQLVDYASEREKYGQMHERNRVAREIHDVLGHLLTGISYGLEATLNTIDVSTESAKKQILKLIEVSRKGIAEVRSSVKALRPDTKLLNNLHDEILKLIIDSETITDINIKWDLNLKDLNFSDDEALTIYRTVQEGITNCIRHSEAKNLYIRLWAEDSNIKITIKDDGNGCKNIKKGFGIHHMEERILLIGGDIKYFSDKGFEIVANIPLRLGE